MNEPTTNTGPRKRSNWNEYFIRIAHEVASRATCDRKHVGCVLVVDRRIVATGFNGSIRGLPHCDDVGHDIVESVIAQVGGIVTTRQNCVRTMHAEANAIAQAARFGIALEGARAYLNTYPCWPCFKLMVSSGITAVYFDDKYNNDPRVMQASKDAGVAVFGPDEWKTIE